MNAIEFGKFLASLRNEKKLTQEELAEKLFIDKRKVSRWECGMSIPDFETIIKLSEILDVTPYEFSICKRLEKEGISKRVINKFKSIKDFKKYKLKKKLLIVLSFILGIFFLLTTIYAIKYYGKVEIYEFKSLDDNYILKGIYVSTNKYSLYNISNIDLGNNDHNIAINNLDSCEISIYDDIYRLFKMKNNNDSKNSKSNNSSLFYYGNLHLTQYADKNLILKISCINNHKQEEHLINFKFVKKFDNKLF